MLSWPGGSESMLLLRRGPRKCMWRTARLGRGAIPECGWRDGKCVADVASVEGSMVRVSDT